MKKPASKNSPVAPLAGEVDSLQRGLEILRTFRTGEKSLRLVDIINRTKMPRLTAQKLLNTLTAHRFLRYVPEWDRFEPDVSCFVLGHAVRASLPILRVASPILRQLAEKLEVDVFLAVRERLDMMIIDYCTARNEEAELGAGSLLPLAQTAVGHAWLWAQRPVVQGDFIERLKSDLDAQEPNGIAAIYRSFQDLAERGYCFSSGEWLGGRHAIATPLILGSGQDVLAIAAVATVPRPKETFFTDTVAPALMDAALRIKNMAPRSVDAELRRGTVREKKLPAA